MDHLRHRSNLVNPACLLSFSKYSPSKAGYQAPAGCGENKTEKKSLLGVLRPAQAEQQEKGLGNASPMWTLLSAAMLFYFVTANLGQSYSVQLNLSLSCQNSPSGRHSSPFYRKDDLTCLGNAEKAGWEWG